MKCQPMTRVRWIELIFGAILPTIFLVPSMLYLLAFAVSTFGMPTGNKAYVGVGMSFIGVVAVLALWLLVLLGSDQVNRYPAFRGFILIAGILGLADALFVIAVVIPSWVGLFTNDIAITWKYMLEDERSISLILVGPVVVGLRYLPRLLKQAK